MEEATANELIMDASNEVVVGVQCSRKPADPNADRETMSVGRFVA